MNTRSIKRIKLVCLILAISIFAALPAHASDLENFGVTGYIAQQLIKHLRRPTSGDQTRINCRSTPKPACRFTGSGKFGTLTVLGGDSRVISLDVQLSRELYHRLDVEAYSDNNRVAERRIEAKETGGILCYWLELNKTTPFVCQLRDRPGS